MLNLFRVIAASFLITTIGLALAAPAWTQTQDWEARCLNANEIDLRIADCTAWIQSSGQETNPYTRAHAYRLRGKAYYDKGLFDQAIDDYTQALSITPDDYHIYNSRAWTYHLKGEDAKALPDANKAVELSGGGAELLRDPRGDLREAGPARLSDRRLSRGAEARSERPEFVGRPESSRRRAITSIQ